MRQLMDQIIVLVFVFVVDKVPEMILTAWPAVVVLEVLFVKVSVQLERSFSRLDALLAYEVSLCVLFLHFLFTLYLILLAYGPFMRWVV